MMSEYVRVSPTILRALIVLLEGRYATIKERKRLIEALVRELDDYEKCGRVTERDDQ
jgi:hypothetical protein